MEREVRWDEQNHVLYSNETDAWGGVMRDLKALEERFEPDALIFAKTSGQNFRKQVDEGYKASRATTRRPMAYASVLEKLEKQYDVRSMPTLEADDVIGILATNSETPTIVCSVDKDMKTVPCVLWNEKELRKIGPLEADYWHMYQTLVGDATDGYPGCPGIGPIKAEKLLNLFLNPGGLWAGVVSTFAKANLTEADALKQARLARILRATDYDMEKQQVILWKP